MQNHYAPPKATVADVAGSSGDVTQGIVDQLRRTKPWALFIAILIFILAVLMVLGTGMMLLGALAMSSMGENEQMGSLFLGLGLGIGIVAVVYFLAGLYLTRFTSAVDRLVQNGSAADLHEALLRQQKFWVLTGIITIITVVLTIAFYAALVAMPELKEMMSGQGL